MALVLRVEPQPLQTLLLPVLMADRNFTNALQKLHVVKNFLEEINAPRALHTISIGIADLDRTIVALQIYRLETMAPLQRGLNQNHRQFGHALFVDLDWRSFHIWTGLNLPLSSTCRKPLALKKKKHATLS